jgi:branched-chain amino acid transport system substrate-binding protein
MKRTFSRAAIVVLVAGLILTACSSTPKSTTASGAGTAAKGKPISVYFLNDQGTSSPVNEPEATESAQAAIDYINDQLGGVNGRPLSMQTCFLDETSATTTKCANQAVAAHPDVIVNGLGSLDNIAATIADQAHIPFVVYSGSTEEPNAFRFTDDQLGPAVAAAIIAKQHGASSLTDIELNFPIVTDAVTAAAPAIKGLGIDLRTETITIDTADQSPQWEAATSQNPGAIVLEQDPADCVAAATAKATLGYKGLFIIDADCDTPAVQTAGGTALNGTVIIADQASADVSNADVKVYISALAKYSPEVIADGLTLSPNSANSFQDFMNLYRVLKAVKNPASIDASTIMSAMKAATNVPVFMGDGATFTCDGKQVPGDPALCSLVQTYSTYNNGNTTYVGSLGSQIVSALKAAS